MPPKPSDFDAYFGAAPEKPSAAAEPAPGSAFDAYFGATAEPPASVPVPAPASTVSAAAKPSAFDDYFAEPAVSIQPRLHRKTWSGSPDPQSEQFTMEALVGKAFSDDYLADPIPTYTKQGQIDKAKAGVAQAETESVNAAADFGMVNPFAGRKLFATSGDALKLAEAGVEPTALERQAQEDWRQLQTALQEYMEMTRKSLVAGYLGRSSPLDAAIAGNADTAAAAISRFYPEWTPQQVRDYVAEQIGPGLQKTGVAAGKATRALQTASERLLATKAGQGVAGGARAVVGTGAEALGLGQSGTTFEPADQPLTVLGAVLGVPDRIMPYMVRSHYEREIALHNARAKRGERDERGDPLRPIVNPATGQPYPATTKTPREEIDGLWLASSLGTWGIPQDARSSVSWIDVLRARALLNGGTGNEVGSFIGGFGLDVGASPLNLIGVGAASIGTKLARLRSLGPILHTVDKFTNGAVDGTVAARRMTEVIGDVDRAIASGKRGEEAFEPVLDLARDFEQGAFLARSEAEVALRGRRGPDHLLATRRAEVLSAAADQIRRVARNASAEVFKVGLPLQRIFTKQPLEAELFRVPKIGSLWKPPRAADILRRIDDIDKDVAGLVMSDKDRIRALQEAVEQRPNVRKDMDLLTETYDFPRVAAAEAGFIVPEAVGVGRAAGFVRDMEYAFKDAYAGVIANSASKVEVKTNVDQILDRFLERFPSDKADELRGALAREEDRLGAIAEKAKAKVRTQYERQLLSLRKKQAQVEQQIADARTLLEYETRRRAPQRTAQRDLDDLLVTQKRMTAKIDGLTQRILSGASPTEGRSLSAIEKTKATIREVASQSAARAATRAAGAVTSISRRADRSLKFAAGAAERLYARGERGMAYQAGAAEGAAKAAVESAGSRSLRSAERALVREEATRDVAVDTIYGMVATARRTAEGHWDDYQARIARYDDGLLALHEEGKRLWDSSLQRLRDEGIDVGHLNAYLPYVVQNKDRVLRRFYGDTGGRYNFWEGAPNDPTKRRTSDSVEEMERLGYDPVTDFLELQMATVQGAETLIRKERMRRAIVDKFATPTGGSFVPPEQYVTLTHGGKEYAVPRDVKEAIDKLDALFTPWELPKLLDTIAQTHNIWQRFWKSKVLGHSGFVPVNVFGNEFMMRMNGFSGDPGSYGRAMSIMQIGHLDRRTTEALIRRVEAGSAGERAGTTAARAGVRAIGGAAIGASFGGPVGAAVGAAAGAATGALKWQGRKAVRTAKEYVDESARFLRQDAETRAAQVWVDPSGRQYTGRELYDGMVRNGIMKSGQVMAETATVGDVFKFQRSKDYRAARTLYRDMVAPVNPLGSQHYMVKTVQGVNSSFESFQRGTMWIDRVLNYGDSFEEAGRRTELALGKYHGYNRFEKVVRHAVPFYGWLKTNVRAQLASILHAPSTLTLSPKVQRAFEDHYEATVDRRKRILQKDLPYMIRGSLGFRIDPKKLYPGGVEDQLLFVNLNVPARDWNLFSLDAGTQWLTMLTPAIKAPAQFVMKRRFDTGQRLDVDVPLSGPLKSVGKALHQRFPEFVKEVQITRPDRTPAMSYTAPGWLLEMIKTVEPDVMSWDKYLIPSEDIVERRRQKARWITETAGIPATRLVRPEMETAGVLRRGRGEDSIAPFPPRGGGGTIRMGEEIRAMDRMPPMPAKKEK